MNSQTLEALPPASTAKDELIVPDAILPEFVLERARARGRRRALLEVATGRELSYAELADSVGQIGAGLEAHGVRARDVLALCLPNSIEFVLTWYAATSIGAVVSPINPQWTGEEIRAQLERSGAKWLVARGSLIEEKLGAGSGAGDIAVMLSIGAPLAQAIPFDALRRVSSVRSGGRVRNTDTACVLTSGGTSGFPKSVMLTHRSLVANLCQTRLVQRVGERDVVIAVLPMFHIFGLQVALNLPLLAGATVLILPRFDVGSFVRTVRDFRVTRVEVVPSIVHALATSQAFEASDLASLRVITSGAAPLSPDIARACARRLGCRVKQGYGMTETCGGTHFAPDDGPDRPESIGPALPGVECRVVDPETGKDVPPDVPGELLVRTASAMSGYLGDPEATAATLDAAGWIHTGDQVTVDSRGWFVITDRLKELIKYKGWQIAPAELEAILQKHPSVADAAVVGSADPIAGEVPKAFVALRSPASARELMGWVAERVATYKQLHQIEFVDTVPRSPAGKILRRLLRERAANGNGGTAVSRTTSVSTGLSRPADRSQTAAREFDLRGKVAVVTGGGRGLGRLIALQLASAGAAVGVIGRSASEIDAVAEDIASGGGMAVAAPADIADARAAARAVTQIRGRLGTVDVLINSAGVGGPVGPLWEVDPTEWWRVFETNVYGSFLATRLTLPDMIAVGHGQIINITSNAALYRWPLLSAYSASKAALVRLTENLAQETRRHGVSVFSVDPGLLPIGLSESVMKGNTEDPVRGHVSSWIREQLANGHGADPEDAVRLVMTVASGRANRLSGRHLSVHDSIDTLLGSIEQIERDDLRTLRLRTAKSV